MNLEDRFRGNVDYLESHCAANLNSIQPSNRGVLGQNKKKLGKLDSSSQLV